MQDAKGKSNKQLYEDYNLERSKVLDKLVAAGANAVKTKDKLWDRSEWLKEEIERLEPIQDVPHLSDGCKTHLCDIYTRVHDGRTSDIASKFLEKGLLLEEDAITLYCELTGKFHKKNKERKYNEWIEGECDIDSDILDLVTDTKVNWDIFTFNRVVSRPIKPLYHWQLDGYMWLWGRSKGELAYCLLNTPKHMLEREERKLLYQVFGSDANYAHASDEEKADFEDALSSLRHNHTYNDKSIQERVRIFHVQRSEERIEKIKSRVEECRIWLNNFAQGKLDTDNED